MKLRTVADLPQHWAEAIAAANDAAYQYCRRVLVGRGFSAAQLDTWDERRIYNRKIAVCMLFEEKGLPDEIPPLTLDRVCKAREELLAADLLAGGVPLEPAGPGVNVGYGDDVDDDDPTLPEPLGRITRDTTL